MQAIEDAFDSKASLVASIIGKVLGFTVGYKLASKETDAFHVKMFNGIGGGVVGGGPHLGPAVGTLFTQHGLAG